MSARRESLLCVADAGGWLEVEESKLQLQLRDASAKRESPVAGSC